MVMVKFAPKDAPYIGKGRWTIPLHLMNNDKFISQVAERGVKLQAEITRTRVERVDRQTQNPQKL